MTTKETVYVSSRQGSRTTYHTTECGNYPENPAEWDREMAESWGLRECKECAGESYRNPLGRAAASNNHD